MKTILLLLILLPFNNLAQYSDTSGLFARWIEIKPDSINSLIFNQSTDDDLIELIESLLIKKQLNIYNQATNINGQLEWKFIDYEEELEKLVKSKDSTTLINPYFMRYGAIQDIPLSDEYGEPLVRLNEDGFEEYVYPPREIFKLYIKDLDAIRIKEVRQQNEETKKFEFKPTDIGFCLKKENFEYERPQELFWVNVDELKESLELNQPKNQAFQLICNGSYKGFQYKQTSREDGNINYFEYKHPIVIRGNNICDIEFDLEKVRHYQTYVIKLNNNCEKTRILLNTSDNSFSIMSAPNNEKKKPLPWTYDEDTKRYYPEITQYDQGTYYLIKRGCHTWTPFWIIIE